MTEDGQRDSIDLRAYVGVLRRHLVLVLLPAVVLSAVAAVLVFSETPLYQSSTRLAIEPVRDADDASFGDFILGNSVIDTEVLVLTSRPVAERVVADLGLDELPAVVTSRISVFQINDTRVVSINATDDDPEAAAALANGFAEAYLSFRRDRALNDITAARDALEERARELRIEIAAVERDIRLGDLTGTATPEGGSLGAERDTLVQQLSRVEDQLAGIGTDAEDLRGGGEVLIPAEPNANAVSPNPSRTLPAAAVLGLLLGIGLAFLRDHLDDAIRSEDDVRRAGHGHTIIGRVRSWGDTEADNRLITLVDPYHPTSEEFQAVAANVRFSLASRVAGSVDQSGTPSGRSILVTSSIAGEGKTTVAGNLAVAAAAAGRRVILVGADLRKPTLSSRFGHPDGVGLSDLLAATGTGEDPSPETIMRYLVDVGMRRLRLLPAGSIPPNPTELLASPQMGWIHQGLTDLADLIIFDTPPLLPVADTLELSQHVDLSFVVVRTERCHRRDLSHALERIEGVGSKLGGLIVNGLPEGRDKYGYGYGRGPEDYRPRTMVEQPQEAAPAPTARPVTSEPDGGRQVVTGTSASARGERRDEAVSDDGEPLFRRS